MWISSKRHVDAADEIAKRRFGEEVSARRARGAVRLRIETRISGPHQAEIASADHDARFPATQESAGEPLWDVVRRRHLTKTDEIVRDEEAPQRSVCRARGHERGRLISEGRRRVVDPAAIAGRDAPLILVRPVVEELAPVVKER